MVQENKKRKGFRSRRVREPLTTRIAGILRAYPDSTQIARELLQNSDDAGATEQWYLLDHRDHAKHARSTASDPNSNEDARLRLFHEDLEEYMGPALLAGSDSVFREEDYSSLENLATSEKRDDKTKIGQMGIGFNSIYHLTDCPSMISGDQFMVIEPHERIFNPERSEFSENAVRGSFTEENQGMEEFPDQLKAFSVLKDIDFSKRYDGTIFRFPLRTPEQAKMSKLSKYFRTSKEVLDMLTELKDEALKALLFLKHVQKIVIYERKEDQDKPTKLFEISVVNSSDVALQRSQLFEDFKLQIQLNDPIAEGDSLDKEGQSDECDSDEEDGSSDEGDSDDEDGSSDECDSDDKDGSSDECDSDDHDGSVDDDGSVHEGKVLECSTRPTYRMTHEDGRTTEETWQVTTRIGNLRNARKSMLTDSGGDENISDHKLIPWVGIAAPLDPKIKIDMSGLFCFLPVGDIQLPFPVHVNGHFAVEQSRRDIWTNTDNKIKTKSSAGIESLWNAHLFSKQIPEAYALFLENTGLDHGTNYQLWPTNCGNGIGRDALWKSLLEATLCATLARNRPVFFCGPKPDGKMSVKPYSKVYIAGRDIDAFPLLKKSLHAVVDLAENVPDVILAELPGVSESLGLDPRILTSALVMSILHDTKQQWSLTADAATRVEMINYCLQDDNSVNLVGLPLLPLAGGLWVEFSKKQAAQRFRVPVEVFRTLSMSNDGLVDIDVEDYPFDDLELSCNSGSRKGLKFNMYWSTMSPSSIAKRIKTLYCQSIYQYGLAPSGRVSQTPGQFPLDTWLMDFWNMAHSLPSKADQKELLSELDSIHLIPIRRGSLAPLSRNRSVLYLHHDASNDVQVSRSALDVLDHRFKCSVLREFPINSSLLNGFLIDVSDGDELPSVLNVLSDVDTDCYQELTQTDCGQLRRYLTTYLSEDEDLDSRQRQVLRYLPVFESYHDARMIPLDTPSSSTKWSVAQGYCHSLQPWVPCSINLLAEDQPMKRHLQYLLEVPFLVKAKYLRLLVSQLNERPKSEWDAILSELFQGYYDHKQKINFVPLLRLLPFVQVKTSSTSKMSIPSRIKPGSTADMTLSTFFVDKEAVFPTGIYAQPAFRGPLEELGMKHEFNAAFVGERMSTLFGAASVGQGASHKKASLALYDRLNSIFSKEFMTDDVLSKILSLPWLYVGTGKRCRPCDCRPKEDRYLVGNLMPISDFSPTNELLRKHMGWTNPPPLDKVLDHFSSLLDRSSGTHGTSSRLLDQDVLPIYKYFAGKIHDPTSLEIIKTSLSDRAWILVSGVLYRVDRVAFKMDFDLSPKLVQVPSSSLDGLYRALGVRENIHEQDIKDLLTSVESMYSEDERLADDDAHFVRRLLFGMAYMSTRTLSLDFPVLTKDGSLKRASDVVYDDRSTRRYSGDEISSYTFLDNSISKEVASRLQIAMFSVRTWDESNDTDFEAFFQQEDLVDRIKSILNDYDPSGIFNEYLQNASDAGATKFSVKLDTRTYDKTRLLSERMGAWQGPALVFYNDAKFTEENFSALCKLGVGNKREDASKVGRHGLGFNSAYHFTDVPSIVSGDSLVFFDPHMANLSKSPDTCGNLVAQKGKRYNLRKLNTETLDDQLQPYKGHFGCDMGSHFNGSIFRIPLRLNGRQLAGSSGFGGNGWVPAQVREMFSSWIEDAKIGMLFLNNIKTIDFYEGENLLASVTKHDRSNLPDVQYLVEPLTSNTTHVSIVDITTSTGSSSISNAVSLSWLVYTEDTLSENAPQDIVNFVRNQHWSTQSGVAIPLGEDRAIKAFQGRLMVHLPTLLETKLPFHLHAGFALTTNRKTLAGGADLGDSKFKWNAYLLETRLPLTAIRAYEQLFRWSFRPPAFGGPQTRDLSKVDIPLFFKRWPLKANESYKAFLQAFLQHTYTTPVFPCRGHLSEMPIVAVAGKDVVLRGRIVSTNVESRVFAWLREGGRSIAETPSDLQLCLREWGRDTSHSFKQIDCNLLRRRLREDPQFIPRQMRTKEDKRWILEEIFKPIADTRETVEEPLDGLCVVPLLSGEWKPLCYSTVYYVATAKARELIEGKEMLVDTDVFDSVVLEKVKHALIEAPNYGIEEMQLDVFVSIFLSENPHGVPEATCERVWKYLQGFPNLTPAHELPILRTKTGDVVTLGVVVFNAAQHWNHEYLRKLQVDYTDARVLELIAKHCSTSVPSFNITSDEAEFLRNTMSYTSENCSNSVLCRLGTLPIWKTFGSPGSPLISAREASFMTDHETLDHLGYHPSVLREFRGMFPFNRMGASPIQAATILRDRIMPKFETQELRCVHRTRGAYLGLCRSLVKTASQSSADAQNVLNSAHCFLARDGSFHPLARMFVPQEDLTEAIFENEQQRFPDHELYTILVGRNFIPNIRRLTSPGVVEECARFVLQEIDDDDDGDADQILNRATHLVRYIYSNPGHTNWMDSMWTFVPRDLSPEYPYNQHTPALPRYMSFSTLCYPLNRDHLWTQRGFFPHDLVPPATFKQQYPDIGSHSWDDCCRHLAVLVKDIAPTLATTERQLTFKATIFNIYKLFEDSGSEDQTAKDSIKKSLGQFKANPYILNGDDKDPTKADSWILPRQIVFGIDHKIGASYQAHPSLMKFRDFLVNVGAKDPKHIPGQVNVGPRREAGVLEDRIAMYFEAQDDQKGFMDVKFVFEDGKSMLAHKVVLASLNDEVILQLTGSCSSMTRHDPSNPAIDVIRKEDKEDDYAAFWGLLYFFYKDELIDTNGPLTLSTVSKSLQEQDPENDDLSQRVEYLMALQRLANMYHVDRLKSLIAEELMLPGKVIYSNVFDIRAHAEKNEDPDMVAYCNKHIDDKVNRSLIKDYLKDEIEYVQKRLNDLDQSLGGKGAELDGGCFGDQSSRREDLEIELESLKNYSQEMEKKR
ncbi:hypothetical protein BGZ96_003187 [Linnemannia gamsii]|uniref:BTB domain-containing protein n=1 Tax=Linnemannia gamsii TaxID=64522 RepID=A0ABQ7K8W5_9FUNG|nr:hypothetical protein BGZ96_003187 [Linnemannia gamsii]